MPRIGRVLIARGRDATDVAISNTFGPNTLLSFKVWTEEVKGGTPMGAGGGGDPAFPPSMSRTGECRGDACGMGLGVTSLDKNRLVAKER